MEDKIKIILDTDVGDDIDDAFAIALSLMSPRIEVLGITTVFRNSLARAKMSKHLANKLKKDIKVYAGVDAPLIQEPKNIVGEEILKKEQLDEFGLYKLPQWLDEMNTCEVEKEHAVDFIISTVHKYPHEVILVPVGPLTNIALAIRKDPSIIPLIKEIRIMGGGIDINFSEWNILCDPEAAHIVYSSGVKLYAVGFNVTVQTGLDKEDVNDFKNSNSLVINTIYEMMMKWFEHYNFDHPIMHDPLAVSTLLDDSIVTFKPMKMKVDLKEQPGRTNPCEDGTTIFVAVAVANDKFKKLLKEVLL